MMSTSISTQAAPTAYPSPSLSPETTSNPTMDSTRRSSVKSLMSSTHPPASPLDALVMALEATAEEMQMNGGESPRSTPQEYEDDDPDATVPSSPTFFMKKSSGPSLHQLPSLLLPESVALSVTSATTSSGLTPSTHPEQSSSQHHRRKMSVSSQGSVSSAHSSSSNSERKIYACTVGNCDKKFTQVAHRRIHER
ncbi:hypothetical protein BG004_003222 [Podila humilis]|nr:hypothetical protein BG004_003222 [Podila humilis]